VTRRRKIVLAAVVAVAAAGAGFGANWWRVSERPDADAAGALLATRLPDLEGREQALSQWQGKVVVVNFWATWCAPCREEIPMFVRFQDRYRSRGLQFVGIAIDRRDPVARFAQEYQVNYPLLMGHIDTLELSRKIGNRAGGLPFTLVFDRRGRLAGTALGELKEARLEALLASVL
jgi:thiol-disulfide isomerase/thioredoxin